MGPSLHQIISVVAPVASIPSSAFSLFAFQLLCIVICLVVLGALMAYTRTAKGRRSPSGFRVQYLRQPLMTATELKFFKRLIAAVPGLVVAPQVAMSGLVDIAAHQNRGRYRHLNRSAFAQKRVDFILIEPSSGAIVHVIELDDHTHDSAAAKAKDRERDSILAQCGYSVLRFDARAMPSEPELELKLSPL